MKSSEKSEIKGPLAFIALIFIVELTLAAFAMQQPGLAAALFILMASIQAATFLLLWYVFRLLQKVNTRLKTLEQKQ